MLFGEQVALAGTPEEQATNLWGMGLLILGAIAWTAGSLYSKYFSKESIEEKGKEKNSMVGIGWQILLAGLAFVIAATVRGEWSGLTLETIPNSAWGAIAYLVIFGSILAYSCYIWLLQVRPATEVSTYAYVNPIVAVALSMLLTDEGITSIQLTGLVIILLSVLLMNWDAYRSKNTSKPRWFNRNFRTVPKSEIKLPVSEEEGLPTPGRFDWMKFNTTKDTQPKG